MADYKQGATWPPHRMKLTDEDGNALPLPEADSIEMIAQSGSTVIQGPLTVIDPPEADPKDPEGPGFNAKYLWQAGDTDISGTYQVEAVITWDEAATPPSIDRVPNGSNPTFIINKKLG